MLPAQYFAGEVGIQQALLEEQGDRTATPDLGEGGGGSQGDEEEAVVAVEAAFQDDGVPMGMQPERVTEGVIGEDGSAGDGLAGRGGVELGDQREDEAGDPAEEALVVAAERTREKQKGFRIDNMVNRRLLLSRDTERRPFPPQEAQQ